MPRMVKLYFTWKMPAFAQLRICVQMSSMLRSRSGLWPSMIAGICARSIDADVIVIGIMSSLMPYDSTCSRCFVSASTDHFSSSFADGMLPQMLLQPKAAIAFRMASRIAVLRSDLELHFRRRCGWFCRGGRRSRDLRGDERFSKRAGGHPAARKPDEFAAIHE